MGLRNFVGTVALLLLGVQVKNVASSSSPWIGQVNDLSSANFDSALAARDVPLWFLDFYAPWCGHCKRLAPVLDEIVLETDKMAVGKIDAVQNRRLADRFKVKGFPTLFYHRNGDTLPYKGGRSKAALLAFAERMSGPPFTEVADVKEASRLASPYAFVLDGCVKDGNIEVEYKVLAGQMQAEEVFFATSYSSPETCRICKVEQSEAPFCVDAVVTGLESMANFVSNNIFQLVTELSQATFRKMANVKGAKMVVAGVQPELEKLATKQALEALRVDGLQRRHKGGDFSYVYTHIDADRFGDWLEGFPEVDPNTRPITFVFDSEAGEYYVNHEGKPLKAFLDGISAGTAKSHSYKRGGGSSMGLSSIVKMFKENMPYSLLMLIPIGAVILLICLIIWEESRPTSAGGGGGGVGDAGEKEAKKDK